MTSTRGITSRWSGHGRHSPVQTGDLLIVPGGAADRAEPLELHGRVAKLGIDATRKRADRADHRPAAPPPEAVAAARQRLESLG